MRTPSPPAVMLHCIRNGLWIAPIFVLAGCWQKIEYTGKPVAATKASDVSSVAADITTDAKPADVSVPTTAPASPPVAEVVSVQPAPEFQPPPATPIPAPPTAASSKPADDDRYAIPAKADNTDASSQLAANDTRPPVPPEQQSPQRHTDATPVSATVDVAPPAVSPNVRRAVWILGSRLSLAALAHDCGKATNRIPTWLDEAHSACKVLETSVPELPEPKAAGDTSPASRQVIDYLLAQGKRIGSQLSKRYGPEQAALFEVALKSNILLLLYSPGSDATNSISAALVRAAPQAKLPDVLWSPLIDRINKKASPDDVQTAVHQMRRDVDAYLVNAAEPTAR
jgi:hypothetical protein